MRPLSLAMKQKVLALLGAPISSSVSTVSSTGDLGVEDGGAL